MNLFLAIRLILLSSALAGLSATPLWADDDFTLQSAQSAATKGDARAQFYLGWLYAHGEGVPRDYGKAVEYFRASAEQGYARAENNLGACYAQGLGGLPQDDAEADQWFRKAAEQGDPLAQFSLGRAYEWGRGVVTNLTEAVTWYQRAAEQNQTNAIDALGDLFLGNQGLPADYKKARPWLEQAAARGSLDALNSLGYICEMNRVETNKNQALAVDYYRQAAEKGLAKAQMNLGRMYMLGIGVKTNYVESYKWFYLAFHNGEKIAQHYLREFEGVPYGDVPITAMTGDQIKEAIDRADEYQNMMGKEPGQPKVPMACPACPAMAPVASTNAVR